MNRLTKWEDANEQWIENHDNDTRKWKNGYRAIMEKLAAYENTKLTTERCAELAEAERDGRLIELPCKVGGTVYRLNLLKNEIFESVIETIALGEAGFSCHYENGDWFLDYHIGKTVFLTREEAECALEGRRSEA